MNSVWILFEVHEEEHNYGSAGSWTEHKYSAVMVQRSFHDIVKWAAAEYGNRAVWDDDRLTIKQHKFNGGDIIEIEYTYFAKEIEFGEIINV